MICDFPELGPPGLVYAALMQRAGLAFVYPSQACKRRSLRKMDRSKAEHLLLQPFFSRWS